jgi:hypothetical protein
MDYRQFHDLESYLLEEVRLSFERNGCLSACDFFCIVIWKANRAKGRVAENLRKGSGHSDLEKAVHTFTTSLAEQPNGRERFRCVSQRWGFSLPMASAILAILYPDEFTVYDTRVCTMLEKQKSEWAFGNLKNLRDFEKSWRGYQEYKKAVEEFPYENPCGTLREKDRYLWGKSFYEQLEHDVRHGFPRKKTAKRSHTVRREKRI